MTYALLDKKQIWKSSYICGDGPTTKHGKQRIAGQIKTFDCRSFHRYTHIKHVQAQTGIHNYYTCFILILYWLKLNYTDCNKSLQIQYIISIINFDHNYALRKIRCWPNDNKVRLCSRNGLKPDFLRTQSFRSNRAQTSARSNHKLDKRPILNSVKYVLLQALAISDLQRVTK